MVVKKARFLYKYEKYATETVYCEGIPPFITSFFSPAAQRLNSRRGTALPCLF
jgi:hypothetical protein